ncbi:MAG: sigma-54 interaction domain-containing protein [Anaerovoracaceae bacterium]
MTEASENRRCSTDVLKTAAEGLSYGMIYVAEDGTIGEYSPLAKEMMGVTLLDGESHPEGELTSGDIVVLLDNDLGNDDKMTPEDLKILNIHSKEIKPGSIVLAIGVYNNKKIQPVYKTFSDYIPDSRVELSHRYLGFSIEAAIDFENRRMSVTLNGKEYYMNYLESIGYMVAIDGMTGNVKFFQAKGYGYRGEEAGELLRGKKFAGKNIPGQVHEMISPIGMKADQILNGDDFLGALKDLMKCEDGARLEGVYEIYRRMVYCYLIRIKKNCDCDGVYVFVQDNEVAENTARQANPLTAEVEKRSRMKSYLPDEEGAAAFAGFIGSSPAMEKVKQLAYKASKTKFNVIITGESGTGKSRLAREIHNSGNQKGPFVEVVCNAIAPSLIESELFGYAPRAFTGADPGGRIGYFEKADGGTIFLDEIGEIPLEIQVKLLHVLQNKRIYRVGSATPVDVDVRVITATNRDLEEEVKQGRFRQDLYYRINVFPIHIPALRERKRDLYILANSVLEDLCKKYDMEMKQFSEEALEIISGYDWPGNVRELENIIERAITVCEGRMIYSENLMIKTDARPDATLRERLEAEERKIIEDTLFKNNDDRKKTMDELGLSRTVFYEKLKKYEINK